MRLFLVRTVAVFLRVEIATSSLALGRTPRNDALWRLRRVGAQRAAPLHSPCPALRTANGWPDSPISDTSATIASRSELERRGRELDPALLSVWSFLEDAGKMTGLITVAIGVLGLLFLFLLYPFSKPD